MHQRIYCPDCEKTAQSMGDSVYRSYTWKKKNHIPGTSVVFSVCKELLRLNTKKTTQLKNVPEICTDISPKKIKKWCRHMKRCLAWLVTGCCRSVATLYPTLCDPMYCSTPGFPAPSPSPGVFPSPCPLNQWCRPTISFSVALFSFCL